jgi:hypothetical protein
MPEYEITRGPIPPEIQRLIDNPDALTHGRSKKYFFADMKIGDSFEITPDKIKAVRSSISQFCKTHRSNNMFKVLLGSNGVYRCWRLK